ncbi:MAG TPA: DUF4402 domain-containing protein, partial [Allosphingosinicella sp.]|nr:DUF4402 domain-containing protein [Allosphingosinicella sp.]
MLRMLKLSIAAAAGLVAAPALAQNTATDSTQGTATIAAPIAIAENSALAFGPVTKPSSGGSTVTINSNDNCNRSVTGNAVLIAGSSGCATYTVTGEAGQAFNIATDTSFTMTRSGGSETLTVTLNKSASTGTIGQASAAFKVGGSFPIDENTIAGAYAGSFNVTVTYQ